MEHLAIMRKSWHLTEKILTGKKKIESRWYKTKYPPWDRIKAGETVYFKDSGEPVKIRAEVDKVIQLDSLDQEKVRKILDEYGSDDGIEREEISRFFEMFKDKLYCILIFLKIATNRDNFCISDSLRGL
jgi:ASC-1-like (ASCH) protein